MALLEVKSLTKRFGGLTAVNDLTFNINKGEIVGMIGPNGAGKTTVFNLVSGFYRPTSGNIVFRGKDITHLSPDRIAAVGLVRSFQQTALFHEFSVLQNVLIGFHLHAKKPFFGSVFNSRSVRSQETTLLEKAIEILEFAGLEGWSSELAKNLPHGHQRVLGVAIALATEPELLLLDEPATGMNAQEISHMMGMIKKIRENGCNILLVEHAMRVVMGICDHIVVLNFGNKIAEGSPKEIQENTEVIKAYLGTK